MDDVVELCHPRDRPDHSHCRFQFTGWGCHHRLDRISVENFVTVSQTQKNWCTQIIIIGKLSSGSHRYRLGAVTWPWDRLGWPLRCVSFSCRLKYLAFPALKWLPVYAIFQTHTLLLKDFSFIWEARHLKFWNFAQNLLWSLLIRVTLGLVLVQVRP